MFWIMDTWAVFHFVQGYDVENVLGKTVGPLTCVVVSTGKRKESGRVVVLQEMPTKTRGDVIAVQVQ